MSRAVHHKISRRVHAPGPSPALPVGESPRRIPLKISEETSDQYAFSRKSFSRSGEASG
jgi:hypothetical protein